MLSSVFHRHLPFPLGTGGAELWNTLYILASIETYHGGKQSFKQGYPGATWSDWFLIVFLSARKTLSCSLLFLLCHTFGPISPKLFIRFYSNSQIMQVMTLKIWAKFELKRIRLTDFMNIFEWLLFFLAHPVCS